MSSPSVTAICGVAAALLSILAGVIYVIDILKGQTRPSRVSWWVSGFVSLSIAASYHSSGARETIWLPLEYGLSFFLIAVLSLKWGDNTRSVVDLPCVVAAVVGLGLWWLTKSAKIALAVLMLVDLIGFIPTIVKTYLRPHTEHVGAWVAAVAASLLNVFAISTWAPEIWAYPVFVFAVNGLFVVMLLLRLRARPMRAASHG